MNEPQTMGAYLRGARRRRRMSIERASEDTKIRADFLMRMESDEFDFLAPAYVRGFLKSYALHLRVDPDPLLREFERRYAVTRVDPTEHLARDRKKMPKERNPRNRWIVAAFSAAAMLVILALIGISQGGGNDPVVGAEDDPSPTAVAGATPSPTLTLSPTPTPDLSESASPDPDDDGAVAVNDGLQVKLVAARAECWVEVTADGEVVFSDTLGVGEEQKFTAESDMSIIFGFAPGVDLYVNGQNFGAPGGPDQFVLNLPEDIDSL